MSQCRASLASSLGSWQLTAAPQPLQGRRAARPVVLVAAGSPGPALRTLQPPSSTGGAPSSSGGAPPLQQPAASSSGGGGGGGGGAPAEAAAVKSYRVSPWQAMKWAGPVPERVNMRLAMMALPYIAWQEMQTGQTGEGPEGRAPFPEACLMGG